MKKICNTVYGIIFILANLLAKFLIFGNEKIWFDNGITWPPRDYYYGTKDFWLFSIKALVPFLIIGGLSTVIYEIILYRKKIFNKKVDAIIPIIIYIFINAVLLYLLYSQCEICC